SALTLEAPAMYQIARFVKMITDVPVIVGGPHATSVPEEVIKKYGADVLRLWVVSEDYTEDLRIGEHILEKIVDAYRKIRNTFRYMLGNLYDFNYEDRVEYSSMTDIDKWVLDKVYNLSREIKEHYDNYELNKIYRKIYEFCNVELSSFYFDVLKDRLYTGKKNGIKRRSTQTAMYYVLSYLVKVIAPILSFTAEDVWQSFFKDRLGIDSVFLTEYDNVPEIWNNEYVRRNIETVIKVREVVLKALEVARREGLINSSLEAKVVIDVSDKDIKDVLSRYESDLWEFFIVSQAELGNIGNSSIRVVEDGIEVEVFRAEGSKCERCWIYSPTVGQNHEYPTICQKCIDNLS
ncbi:MAG: class I tRNA ligase family protein, partial [Brevinematia bacterium]